MEPEENWDPCLAGDGDSNKVCCCGAVQATDESDGEEVDDWGGDWGHDLEDDILSERMIHLASKTSMADEDWIPYRQQWLRDQCKSKKGELSLWDEIFGC
jgi:hypothetical protein